MPMLPPPDLASLSLAQIAQLVQDQKLPPVESWNPTHCGNSDMKIARDGTWFYQGSPIGRPAMVRLFASVLRREADGSHVLVTPVEKLDIEVEDAPFVAVEMKVEGTGEDSAIAFRLNTGDLIPAGPDHGLRFEEHDDGPHPYLHVRGGLEALVSRALYYDLVAIALENGSNPPGIWSNHSFFAMAPEGE